MDAYSSKAPGRVTPENAEAAEDFIELAESSTRIPEILKYARKAQQKDPGNIDAMRMTALFSTNNPYERLLMLEKAIKTADQIMESEGFKEEDCIGNYWQILETRPYMRLRNAYFDLLIDNRMMRRAAAEGEEMIRLNTNDNMGIRFTLIHLYAYLEEEAPALRLLGQYESGGIESRLSMAVSAMYFKLGRMDKAREYLDLLARRIPDTKKYFRAYKLDKLDEIEYQMPGYGYRPNTIEELLENTGDYGFFYDDLKGFFLWADKQLVIKKK